MTAEAQVAANSAGAACSLDAPSFVSSAPNIFNDQQEQDLGDALAEYEESDYRIAVPAADDQLTKIGERLLAALPPTGVHYRFRIYDSGEVNGFSLAGGRVYISRKLVAAVKNEDELAGVLAHEIGHIRTHQTAIEFTRIFRIRLGVTQVTDRADIFAKVHQMLSTPAKPNENQDADKLEKKDQLLADHVAVYAMVRAGYAIESFASFMDESMMNKGKTGNWLSDMMGLTHEESQRYRTALKLIGELPAGCKQKPPVSDAAFTAWLRAAVDERATTVATGIEGDRPLKLDPPLRPSLWRIRFSPDGKYVLGQDEGSITVVDRNAGRVLFRIDAPDVEAAQFTPDSQSLVFHDTKLRVEQWTIATGKRAWVKELVLFDGCTQTLLSPDAKTLVCAAMTVRDGYLPRVGVRLIDVESGKAFYDKPSFYETGTMSPYAAIFLLAYEGLSGAQIASMVISPDGRYLVLAVADRVMAYDLEHRQPVTLGGKLHELTQTRMSFLGPDQMYVVGASKGNGMFATRIVSFPDGQVLKEGEIGVQEVRAVANGRLLIANPLKSFAVALFDPNAEKFIAASNFPAMDAWDKTAAIEDGRGALMIGQVGINDTKHVALPLGPLPSPRSAQFSADGKYLAVSLSNRAEIWELETGKQVGMMRPFRSAWFDGADHLMGQFPKYVDKEPVDLEMSMSPWGAKELGKYDSRDWQYHELEFHLKPMGKDKTVTHHTTLEVKKMQTQAVAWTRDYPKETPACWPAEDDRLVLAWDLTNDAAKAEIKSYAGLQREQSALKGQKRGLLLETVSADTGAPLEQVVIPEADLTKGSDDVRRARVSGEFVMVQGEHGNTVIYRLDTGVKVGEFFGSVVATNADAGLVAAVNREDEVLVVEESSGKELKRFSLGSPVRLTRIVSGKGKMLLVLTADQVVHRLPLSQ